jgi:hypothetical protein
MAASEERCCHGGQGSQKAVAADKKKEKISPKRWYSSTRIQDVTIKTIYLKNLRHENL